MRKIWSKILILSLLAFPLAMQAKLFDGEEFVLDNGLQVIVLPNHRVPVVKQMVWYKAGSADEPAGKGGISHLLEHLMFRGTPKVSGQKFNTLLEENGAESNAFTSMDVTAYHQLLDRSRLELAMFLEADRMQNLRIHDQDFDLERKIVYEERKQRIDNNPVARFAEIVGRVLWQDHPYGRPVSGTEREILTLEREDAEVFYRGHYAPDNAVLVLAGDITGQEAKVLAEKYYGPLEAAGKKTEDPFAVSPAGQEAMIEIAMPEIQGTRVMQLFAAPSYNKQREDVYALSVWAGYLGEGETSALYKKLVLRDKKALGVSADYDPAARDYGRFAVSAVPAPGVGAKELLKAMNKAWEEAVAEFDDAAAQRVKKKMLAGLVYLQDNPEEAAYVAGSLASAGLPLAEIELQDERIRAVSGEQVLAAARRLREKAPSVVGILKPEERKQ